MIFLRKKKRFTDLLVIVPGGAEDRGRGGGGGLVEEGGGGRAGVAAQAGDQEVRHDLSRIGLDLYDVRFLETNEITYYQYYYRIVLVEFRKFRAFVRGSSR